MSPIYSTGSREHISGKKTGIYKATFIVYSFDIKQLLTDKRTGKIVTDVEAIRLDKALSNSRASVF